MLNILPELGSQVNTDNDLSRFYHPYNYPVTWFMFLVVGRSLASVETTKHKIPQANHDILGKSSSEKTKKLPIDQYAKDMGSHMNYNTSMTLLVPHECEIAFVSFFPSVFN